MQTLDAAPGNTIEVRPGSDRGTFTNHWLHARFSFSFGAWQQPGRVGFGPLRAASGIRHSQMNASTSGLDHHLQIWLTPRQAGGTPTIEARDFDLFSRPGEWCPVISPDGRAGSFVFDAGAFMATTSVREGEAANWWPREASMAYLHAIDGSGVARAGRAGREIRLGAGDALANRRTDAQPVRVESQGPPARFLIFEFFNSGAA